MAVLRNMRWLSVHIALGAISVLLLVDKVQELNLPFPVYLCLFNAVWSIYLMDHWRDARSTVTLTARRQFHRDSQAWIVGLLITNIFSGAVAAIFVPITMLLVGSVVAIFCLAYLTWARRLGQVNMKEAITATLYSFGIFLAPLITGDLILNLVMALQLGVLAFANLVLFSSFEEEHDKVEGFDSLATNLGASRSNRVLTVTLGVLAISLPALQIAFNLPWRYELFILLGTLTIGGLSLYKDLFRLRERYRVIGDVIFFFPLLLLI